MLEPLNEAAIPIISPQQAKDRKMFGPVYHGTERDIEGIMTSGFSAKHSVPSGVSRFDRPTGTSHGYGMTEYAMGIAPPIHHLGFGTYFTTVKAIAKNYNGGTIKGLKTFYIDTQNIETINFGAPNTMMKWWRQNGYDMTYEATRNKDFKAWIKATGNLTRNLRNQHDVVHFLGKGIRKLLDGDQVVVFNSKLIYAVNPKLASGLELGAKVLHNQVVKKVRDDNSLYVDDLKPGDFGSAGRLTGWRGIFRAHDHDGNDVPRSGTNGIGNYPIHMIPPADMVGTIVEVRAVPEFLRAKEGDYRYDVKWSKGGIMYNYLASELKPIS